MTSATTTTATPSSLVRPPSAWPVATYGNAEPVASRQARPEDDTAVVVMVDAEGKRRYFRFDFGEIGREETLERASAFAHRRVAEGYRFLAGHFGYVAETGKDYTRTGDWELRQG